MSGITKSAGLWSALLLLSFLISVDGQCQTTGISTSPRIVVNMGSISSADSTSALYLRGALKTGSFLEAILNFSSSCTSFLQPSRTYYFPLTGTSFASTSNSALKELSIEVNSEATFGVGIKNVTWVDSLGAATTYVVFDSHPTYINATAGIYLSPLTLDSFQTPAICWNLFKNSSYCTCPPGSAATGTELSGSCEQCLTGQYANFSGASTCLSCSTGYYLATSSPPLCAPCGLGRFAATSVTDCSDCEAGKYANSSGSSTCSSCNAGQFSLSQSSVCSPCDPGKYSTLTNLGSSCSLCPPTQYANVAGMSFCNPCEAGKYSNSEGTVNCSICDAGTYSPSGNSFCEQCGEGTYSNQVQATSGNTCQNCGVGTYAANKGQTACTKCPKGKYSIAVQGKSLTTCSDCQAGRASFFDGATSCVICLGGSAAAAGSSSCDTCPAGKYSLDEAESCTNCTEGYYSSDNSTTCQSCDQGKFAAQPGKDFLLLFFSFGVSLGLFNALTTLIEQILCTRGYSDEDVGYFGGIMIVMGIIGSIIAGLILDKTKKFEETAKVCFAMSCLASIFFCIVQLYDNDRSVVYYLVLVSFACVGFFGLPLLPVCMEMSVECVYPIPEATSTGLLFMSGQLTGILMIILYPKTAVKLDPASYEYNFVQTCASANGTSDTSDNLTVLDFKYQIYFQTLCQVFVTLVFIVFFKCAYLRLRSERERLAEKILNSS